MFAESSIPIRYREFFHFAGNFGKVLTALPKLEFIVKFDTFFVALFRVCLRILTYLDNEKKAFMWHRWNPRLFAYLLWSITDDYLSLFSSILSECLKHQDQIRYLNNKNVKRKRSFCTGCLSIFRQQSVKKIVKVCLLSSCFHSIWRILLRIFFKIFFGGGFEI